MEFFISLVCLEFQEMIKVLEKRHFLTSSNLTNSNSQYTDRNNFNSASLTNSNTINSSWSKSVPPIPRFQQQVFSQQGPLPQPPPLYAVPVPRSQRSHLNDLYTSSPRTPSSSVNSAQSQNNVVEPIYSNEVLQNLVDTLTEEFANENVLSYMEGTTTFVDQYYSNLYNTDERLSQSSSTNMVDATPNNNREGTIKSILKKRENVSNKNLDGCDNLSAARTATPTRFGSSSSSGLSSQHASQDLRLTEDGREEKDHEVEERLLTDLSPSRVFLETR